MSPNKKRRMIHSDERNCILKVLKFFEKEAALGVPSIPIKQAQKRTALATDTAMRTISRIKREAEISTILQSPGKQRGPQRNRNALLNVDDFDLCVIRQTISEFYVNKRMPSVSALLPVIKTKINFPWKEETLRRVSFFSTVSSWCCHCFSSNSFMYLKKILTDMLIKSNFQTWIIFILFFFFSNLRDNACTKYG